MLVICCFYFFILVNAFYGGAMTMFFSSEITLPFETIGDVMGTYPTWNLMVDGGSDAIYRAKAVDGDRDYIDFVRRMDSAPDLTLFSTIGMMHSNFQLLTFSHNRCLCGKFAELTAWE